MKEALGAYAIGEVILVSKIPTGLIHETYKVEAGAGSFILQRQHAIFDKTTVEDVNAVSQYLVKKRLVAQTVVKTRAGALSVEYDGGVWRLLTFIPGDVFETVPDEAIAYEAGNILGKFHRALENFDRKFRTARPLHPYNTGEHLRLLQKVTSAVVVAEIREEVSFVLETLPGLLLPVGLRRTITHGDPKITNVIFQNQKAVALIDIDDVGRGHNVLAELGDAFRSWCGKSEGEAGNRFNVELFRAGLRGYDEGSHASLLPEERILIPRAIQLITLGLAARFLRDYVEDCYFGWDPTRYGSRKAHNLARARGQIALYRDIVSREKELFGISP